MLNIFRALPVTGPGPGAAARRRFSGLDPNAFAGVKMEKRQWD
jgi:hypothetical protein